jgi:hypothetical protein
VHALVLGPYLVRLGETRQQEVEAAAATGSTTRLEAIAVMAGDAWTSLLRRRAPISRPTPATPP